jgi:protein ImuB
MLWLCISLPQWPLESLHSGPSDQAVVVTTCEGSTRWILCCNDAAEQAHLKAAMNYTVALAVHPQAVMLERNIAMEREALRRLAAWAYQFSGTVILGDVSPDRRRARMTLLWLEIGSSLRLFGGFRKLIERIEQGLQQLEYHYLLGVAPTLEGAALLARAEIRVAITTLDALRSRISALPISKLALDPEILQQLHTAGVRTVGLLLDIPRAAVARRFGPQVSQFLDRLTGQAADPRPTFKLPDRYSARMEFEFEVRSTESLLFPVRRMLREFVGFLRARDTGVQHFKLTLMHREMPATELRIGLSIAERNAERFFALVRERLERTQLAAPAIALSLEADEFTAPATLQTNLMDGAATHVETLSHTVDRIVARLGMEQVHGLKQVADHRPEKSWAPAPPGETSPVARVEDRPLWLLPEPRPLSSSSLPQIQHGLERIESGWWDGGDVRRDYFVARTNQGAALWVFRDLRDGRWYLHGFWS